jgi:hypothetical protein
MFDSVVIKLGNDAYLRHYLDAVVSGERSRAIMALLFYTFLCPEPSRGASPGATGSCLKIFFFIEVKSSRNSFNSIYFTLPCIQNCYRRTQTKQKSPLNLKRCAKICLLPKLAFARNCL